jgi:hypothetical protein
MITKTRRNFSLLAAALVLALAFTACDKSKSKFEGTWRYTIPGVGSADYVFTGNEFAVTMFGENFNKGTFTYTATNITMTQTHAWSGSAWTAESDDEVVSYTLSGNTLTMTMDGETIALVKQP